RHRFHALRFGDRLPLHMGTRSAAAYRLHAVHILRFRVPAGPDPVVRVSGRDPGHGHGLAMNRATIPIQSANVPSNAFEYFSTKKDEFVGWARKFSLFPYPFVTACCAMEFMAVSSTPYDTDRFGAALPRFSPRQSDLLMVVGTVTHKQAPVLLRVYEQMCEPKWVMAFGACATSGGFYQNYAAV